MSYDLIALRVPPGTDPLAYYSDEEREEEIDDAPPTASEREQMERLASAVAALDPSAERYDGDDVIEFTTDAIQVSLFAREAAITMPYWFDGAEAEQQLARMTAYAQVLREHGGYTVIDPQTEEVVGDTAIAADTYAGTREAVKRIGNEKRRWWRRGN
jgi:hypothetical protein